MIESLCVCVRGEEEREREGGREREEEGERGEVRDGQRCVCMWEGGEG